MKTFRPRRLWSLSRWTAVGGLVVAPIISACHDSLRPEVREYDAAVARWNASRPSDNSYVIQQQVSCFCAFGGTVYRVTVTNGAISRVVESLSQTAVPSSDYGRFRTIDQLFAEVRASMQVPGRLRDVKYDAQRGYPLTVSIDPIPHAVDDEVAYFTAGLAVESQSGATTRVAP